MKPEYAWLNGKKLGYIESRKQIYIPLYSEAVQNALKMSWTDVVNDSSRIMGHGFVLSQILREKSGILCI